VGEMIVVGRPRTVRLSNARSLHVRVSNILRNEEAKILVAILFTLLLVSTVASSSTNPVATIDFNPDILVAMSPKTPNDQLIFGIIVPDAQLCLNKFLMISIKGSSCVVVFSVYNSSRYFIYGKKQVMLFDNLYLVSAVEARVDIYKIKTELGNTIVQDIYAFKTNCNGPWKVYVNETIEIVGTWFVTIKESKVEKEQVGKSISGDPLGFLNTLIHYIIDAFSAFIQILFMAANTITNIIANGLKVLSLVIGRPGDPYAQFYAAQYRLALMQHENNPYIGNDVKAVLNCTKPLKEVKGLIPSLRPEDAAKTICQVEDSAPQGIVGFMSTVWSIVLRAGSIVVFIVKNFVLINAVTITSILAFGAAGTIKKKSIEPLANSLHIIYSIFKFYWSIGVFIFNAGLKFVQAAALLGSVLIQLGEKVYNVAKTAITIIITIIKAAIMYKTGKLW